MIIAAGESSIEAAFGPLLIIYSDLDGFHFFGTLESLGITETDFTYQAFVDRMPVNAVLICRVSGLTFTPTNGEFYLRATCTGFQESKRIEFEAIEMSSSLSGIYKARYSAPAGTKWTGWKTALTNANLVVNIIPISYSIPASGEATINANIARNGYTPLGVLGLSGLTSYLTTRQYYCDTEKAYVSVYNRHTAAQTGTCNIRILYKPS